MWTSSSSTRTAIFPSTRTLCAARVTQTAVVARGGVKRITAGPSEALEGGRHETRAHRFDPRDLVVGLEPRGPARAAARAGGGRPEPALLRADRKVASPG